LLDPAVLLFSGACSGVAAAGGGLLAFVAPVALYSRAPPGDSWCRLAQALSFLLFLLPPTAVAAAIVTCLLLLPLHCLLVRFQLRSHIFYLAAMLAIVFAAYYVLTATRDWSPDWSLAFTIPFAVVPGALAFRHFAYNVRPIRHGYHEALVVLLWAVVVTAHLNWVIMMQAPSAYRVEIYRLWISYGMPAMTLVAMTALFARAWSRRVMAALTCVGLAIPLLFAAAFLAASLLPRLAANDCSPVVHRQLDFADRAIGLQKASDRDSVDAGQILECHPVEPRNAG
jgi:hypothetical protein